MSIGGVLWIEESEFTRRTPSADRRDLYRKVGIEHENYWMLYRQYETPPKAYFRLAKPKFGLVANCYSNTNEEITKRIAKNL